MAIQLAISTRNARLDAIETDAGTSANLDDLSGSMPANCAAATPAPSSPSSTSRRTGRQRPAAAAKALNSLPLSTTGAASGTAGYFRLFKTDGTTCMMQGTVTATGGGGDMTLDNTSIASGQTVNVPALR